METIKTHRRAILVMVALLAVAGVGAAWLLHSDPVEHVRQLGQKMRSKELSAEERKEIGKQFRAEMKNLTPQQRKELRADRQQKMANKLKDFFKLSKDEQLKQLDKDIDRMQAARKRWQEGGGKGGGFGAAGGDNSAAKGGSNTRGNGGSGAARTDANGQPVAFGGPGGPGGPGDWRGRSPEQREAFRQTMLDNTSPEFRGQMAEYRQMLGSRAQQRGVGLPMWQGR